MEQSETFRTISAHSKMPNVTVYFRGKYVNKDGKCQVYLFVYLNYTRVTFKTGVYVKAADWNAEKQIVRKGHPEASDLNLIIRSCRARANDILVRYRLQYAILTPDLLRLEYERPSVDIDFLKFMENAIKERKGELTDSTMKLHRSIRKKLEIYKTPIAFAELTEEFFAIYNRYLKNTHNDGQNTRHNNLKILKTYIRIAMRKGLMTVNPLLRLPVKKGAVDRCYLTDEEFRGLLKLYRSEEISVTWQRILGCFLFACLTGLRISDVKRVKMEDIIGNMLIVVPHKTKNVNLLTVKIPLVPLAWSIIKNESPYRVAGKIFTSISDQKTNLYLKDIAKAADILKSISFHVARHTFATMFLRKTNNLAALQKLLGHSKITQTMEYAHVLTEDIENEMRIFGDF